MHQIAKPDPLESIRVLQAQIDQLKESAIAELKARKEAILAEIGTIDADMEKLTGRPVRNTPAIRSVTFQELKDLLQAEPTRALNVRRAGLDGTNVKTLANLHPRELDIEERKRSMIVRLK